MAALFVHDESLTPPPRGWHHHLEGWQLAVVAVGMALGAAILAVPRAVPPDAIPLPRVDRVGEARAEARERALARRAAATPLPFLVRAAGEAFRRFGVAEAKEDASEARALSEALVARVAEARRRHGDEALLSLRAVQSELFVRAVTRWAASRGPDAELDELGGSFVRRAEESGFIAAHRQIAIDADALATIFTIRWTKLAGLIDVFPFAPSLNEWRLYYRTLLTHPALRPEGRRAGPSGETEILAAVVDALSRRDPDYPALLARGILEHWAGHYSNAAALFSAHLASNPSGPWRLRAQNYLLAAYRHVPRPAR
jgi:hypothetical protein